MPPLADETTKSPSLFDKLPDELVTPILKELKPNFSSGPKDVYKAIGPFESCNRRLRRLTLPQCWKYIDVGDFVHFMDVDAFALLRQNARHVQAIMVRFIGQEDLLDHRKTTSLLTTACTLVYLFNLWPRTTEPCAVELLRLILPLTPNIRHLTMASLGSLDGSPNSLALVTTLSAIVRASESLCSLRLVGGRGLHPPTGLYNPLSEALATCRCLRSVELDDSAYTDFATLLPGDLERSWPELTEIRLGASSVSFATLESLLTKLASSNLELFRLHAYAIHASVPIQRIRLRHLKHVDIRCAVIMRSANQALGPWFAQLWPSQTFRLLFEPSTPIKTLQLALTEPQGAFDVVSAFYAEQPVKTLKHVRIEPYSLRERLGARAPVVRAPNNRLYGKLAGAFRDWSLQSGVQVEVERA